MPDPSSKPRGVWSRRVAAAILWAGVCSAAVCISTLGLLSVKEYRSPLDIGRSYTALVIGQVVFLVFLWPLFTWRSANSGRPMRDALDDLAHLAGFLLLALPLVLITLRPSDASAGTVWCSQGLVALIGLCVLAAARLPGAGAWYYPLAYLVCAVAPFAAYLLRATGRVSMSWAGAVTPVWAAIAAAGDSAACTAPLIVFAALAAVLGAASVLLSRR